MKKLPNIDKIIEKSFTVLGIVSFVYLIFRFVFPFYDIFIFQNIYTIIENVVIVVFWVIAALLIYKLVTYFMKSKKSDNNPK